MDSEYHMYESSLPEFLDWASWVYENCTNEEIEFFLDDTIPVIPQKHILYERWIVDQKITKHTTVKNDVVVFERIYS